VPGRKQDDSDIRPGKPGWYPDPWSADGRGERYFDGKKWGTTERPLPREATVTQITSRRTARLRLRPFGPVLIFAAAVLLVWGIGRLRHSGNSRTVVTAPPVTSPGPTVTLRPVTSHLGTGPPAGVGEAAAPLGRPAPVPAGNGKYAFEREQPDDPSKPVAFDPCRAIHYVVNPAGAPSDGAAQIRSAVARVQAATGLRFVDDGPTTERPSANRPAYQPARYPRRWAPVLIAWSDEEAYAPLAGEVAGLGQSVAAESNHGRLAYVSGQVVLDDRQLAPSRLADRAEVRAVLLHELGHVVGLDHTSDVRQLMFSESQFNVTDYVNGDLRGLALLGTQNCFPDL
jgi:Matrixin/Protein of unknown function (DUF2510)